MNADSSPGNPSGKLATLSGCAAWVFQLLRMFWLTELALLVVILYGLWAGWSTPRQWSDGLFIDAAIQILVALVAMYGIWGEALDASSVRYIDQGNVRETHYQLALSSLHRSKFGVRAFVGGLLTILISVLVMRV